MKQTKLNDLICAFGGLLILLIVIYLFIFIWTLDIFYLKIEATLILLIVINYYLDKHTRRS